MLTNIAVISCSSNHQHHLHQQCRRLLLLLCLSVYLCRGAAGVTVTWGYVNKYASTLHAQDIYLVAASGNSSSNNNTNSNNNNNNNNNNSSSSNTDLSAYTFTDVADIVFGAQNASASNAYTITAVHAYDMTPPTVNAGHGGGTAALLEGGVGEKYAKIHFERDNTSDYLSPVHFKLVIYGVDL